VVSLAWLQRDASNPLIFGFSLALRLPSLCLPVSFLISYRARLLPGLLVIACASSAFVWAKPWVTTEVDAYVSASFPETPHRVAAEGQQQLRVDNARCRFVVLSRPLPASFSTDSPRDINQMLTGIVKGAVNGAEGELTSTRDVNIGTASGRHITYNAPEVAGGPLLPRYKTLLILNHRLYQFDCWLHQATARAEADREQFFAAIAVRERSPAGTPTGGE
jgi:hypothetical protein